MGRVLCRARLGLLPRVGGVGPSWAIERGLSQERRHHSPSSVVVILRQVSLGRSSRPRRGSENKRAPSWSHSVASRQPGPRSPWEGPAKPRTGGSKESEAASGTTGARARAGLLRVVQSALRLPSSARVFVSFDPCTTLRWRCSCHLEFAGERRLRAVSVWCAAELVLGLSYPAPGPGHLTRCLSAVIHGPTEVQQVVFPGDCFSGRDLSL